MLSTPGRNRPKLDILGRRVTLFFNLEIGQLDIERSTGVH